jgi:hypothetical protein
MNPIEFVISLAIFTIPTWIFYLILVKKIPLNLKFFSKIFLWLLIGGLWISLLGIIFYPYLYTEGTLVPSRKQDIMNSYNGIIIIIKLLLLTYILETTIYYLIGVYYKRIGNEEKSKEFMRICK